MFGFSKKKSRPFKSIYDWEIEETVKFAYRTLRFIIPKESKNSEFEYDTFSFLLTKHYGEFNAYCLETVDYIPTRTKVDTKKQMREIFEFFLPLSVWRKTRGFPIILKTDKKIVAKFAEMKNSCINFFPELKNEK